jgi:hypothetical protein
MARIRTVKPELFRHGGLYDLECDTGLPIRLAFIGLFTSCDRNGRFKWKTRELKLDCLPHDNIDFSRVLDALLSRGFILKYANSGVEYGCIPTFTTHQVINNKEKATDAPCPYDADSQIIDFNDDSTRGSRVGHACPSPLNLEQGERKGRERKGREGKGKEICQQADDAFLIFDYWCQVMGKTGNAKFTDKREKAVKKRLSEGYTVEHIKQAIDGCKRSPFHMGQNENRTVYDDLELICRDGGNLEKFALNVGVDSFGLAASIQGYEEFLNE